MLTSIAARILALALLAASALAFGFWQDSAAKAKRIVDLEARVAEQAANASAMRTLAMRRQRVEISYRDATQGLNPDALSQACRADPELARAYLAIERMRNDEANDTGRKPTGRLPASSADPQPGH